MGTFNYTVVLGGDTTVNTGLPAGASGTGIKLQDYSQQAQVVSWTGAVTVDVDNGNRVYATLTGDVTSITLQGFPGSGEEGQVNFYLIQGTGAPHTISWPTSISWVGGVAPVLSSTETETDIVSLTTVDGGTTFIGFYVGRAS